MAHGGRRSGAGRKAGSGWESPRPATLRAAARDVVHRVLESDRNPIKILLEIASDESHPVDSRIAAANYAAPYLFPRLSAAVIDARHTVERIDSTDLIARLSDRIARLAPPELCGGSRGGGRVTATSHSLKLSVCKFIRQWNVWWNYLAMKDLAVRAIVSMSCSRVTHTYRPKRAPRKL